MSPSNSALNYDSEDRWELKCKLKPPKNRKFIKQNGNIKNCPIYNSLNCKYRQVLASPTWKLNTWELKLRKTSLHSDFCQKPLTSPAKKATVVAETIPQNTVHQLERKAAHLSQNPSARILCSAETYRNAYR